MNLQPFDFENGYYHTAHPMRIAKTLAHYEIYKKILNLPGEIVECGVFKGCSLIRFCTFREILESPYSRKIIGFDAFGKFPKPEKVNEADAKFIDSFEEEAGDGLDVEQLDAILKNKPFANYELVAGNIAETAPFYLQRHSEMRIALLHLDLDVYEPTKQALTYLYDKVVKGGVIVFDDYGYVAGATRAVDEFFQKGPSKLEKLPVAHRPAFIVKLQK